jgi:hypothetical protein
MGKPIAVSLLSLGYQQCTWHLFSSHTLVKWVAVENVGMQRGRGQSPGHTGGLRLDSTSRAIDSFYKWALVFPWFPCGSVTGLHIPVLKSSWVPSSSYKWLKVAPGIWFRTHSPTLPMSLARQPPSHGEMGLGWPTPGVLRMERKMHNDTVKWSELAQNVCTSGATKGPGHHLSLLGSFIQWHAMATGATSSPCSLQVHRVEFSPRSAQKFVNWLINSYFPFPSFSFSLPLLPSYYFLQ